MQKILIIIKILYVNKILKAAFIRKAAFFLIFYLLCSMLIKIFNNVKLYRLKIKAEPNARLFYRGNFYGKES